MNIELIGFHRAIVVEGLPGAPITNITLSGNTITSNITGGGGGGGGGNSTSYNTLIGIMATYVNNLTISNNHIHDVIMDGASNYSSNVIYCENSNDVTIIENRVQNVNSSPNTNDNINNNNILNGISVHRSARVLIKGNTLSEMVGHPGIVSDQWVHSGGHVLVINLSSCDDVSVSNNTARNITGGGPGGMRLATTGYLPGTNGGSVFLAFFDLRPLRTKVYDNMLDGQPVYLLFGEGQINSLYLEHVRANPITIPFAILEDTLNAKWTTFICGFFNMGSLVIPQLMIDGRQLSSPPPSAIVGLLLWNVSRADIGTLSVDFLRGSPALNTPSLDVLESPSLINGSSTWGVMMVRSALNVDTSTRLVDIVGGFGGISAVANAKSWGGIAGGFRLINSNLTLTSFSIRDLYGGGGGMYDTGFSSALTGYGGAAYGILLESASRLDVSRGVWRSSINGTAGASVSSAPSSSPSFIPIYASDPTMSSVQAVSSIVIEPDSNRVSYYGWFMPNVSAIAFGGTWGTPLASYKSVSGSGIMFRGPNDVIGLTSTPANFSSNPEHLIVWFAIYSPASTQSFLQDVTLDLRSRYTTTSSATTSTPVTTTGGSNNNNNGYVDILPAPISITLSGPVNITITDNKGNSLVDVAFIGGSALPDNTLLTVLPVPQNVLDTSGTKTWQRGSSGGSWRSNIASVVFNITLQSNNNGNDGISFADPVYFTFKIEKDNLVGLCLGYINESTNLWECEDESLSWVAQGERLVGCKTSHFTSFAIIVQPNAAGLDGDVATSPTAPINIYGVAFGVAGGVLVGVVIVVVLVYYYKKRERKTDITLGETEML
eukprot:TRINITY_DN2931_c0_g3_i1.p1 TRINITY_DN2931_c0_g3~~TRINITY_DN2931_c0_g3_i1.p1  ORF type:complete len:939 (-),score=114.51 TRINITY_DN2931_c0_g3_i1:15-2507(-)